MAFTEHFRLYLNHGTNSYYRVTKENKHKFEKLKSSLIFKAKQNQLISESEICNLFGLLIDIGDEEFKHYLNEADLHTLYVTEYFAKKKNYLWHEFVPAKGDGADYFDSSKNKFIRINLEEISDEGFDFMIMQVIHEYLKKDKCRNPPVMQDECIKELIVELLKYRRDEMKENIRPFYTRYKISVVAAVITDILMNLIPEPRPGQKPHNNKQYYLFAEKGYEMAQKEHPELFKGLPE